jgi:hypothetical protein
MFNVENARCRVNEGSVDYDLPFTQRLKLLLEADIFSKLLLEADIFSKLFHEDDRQKILNKRTDIYDGGIGEFSNQYDPNVNLFGLEVCRDGR